MRALFADLPEACDNTLVIARRCAFIPQLAQADPAGLSDAPGGDATRTTGAARGGARRARRAAAPARPGARADGREPYRERLEFELETIIQMGFAGYFLIVADFIQWAKRQGIPVGPGRGSGAGSVVAWALDDHRSRPAALRPAVRAVSQPRARVDAGFRRRFLPGPARRGDPLRPAEIRPRPGRADHHLRQIAGARRAARCRPRARRCPTARSTGCASWCRTTRRTRSRLEQAIAGEPLLQQQRDADETVARLIDDRAEARRPLPARLDACRRRRDRRPAAVRAGAALPRPALRHAGDAVQHEMGRAGRARQIRLSRPQDPDRAGALPRTARQRAASSSTSPTLPLDDRPTFDLLSRGDTVGVFQLEGAGMRDMLKQAAARPLRGHHRGRLAVPARADGEHPALYRGQARRGAARLPAPAAGADPEGDLRDHDLPGAGHADRAGAGRLFARRRRSACAARWARRSSRKWTRSASNSSPARPSAASSGRAPS